MYIARIYEKLIDNRKVYSAKKLVVPRPEFIVLYNGVEPYPDRSVLRLSESFEGGLPVLSATPALELEAKVYNRRLAADAPDFRPLRYELYAFLAACCTCGYFCIFIQKYPDSRAAYAV
jgi:hypothetical protein